MPKITYIEANGTAHVVIVAVGQSVMRGAVLNNVPGILGECGGECACGTCRVFVDPAWRAQTGQASTIEEAIMDAAEPIANGERLSCQIKVTDALDGLVVRMPERQF